MGDVEHFLARLGQLQRDKRIDWYPSDLVKQLKRPKVRKELEELEERSHHGDPVEVLPPGLLDLPVAGLDHIFFYRPGELVVDSEAADETRRMLRRELRADPSQRSRSEGFEVLPVDTDDLPRLAKETYDKLTGRRNDDDDHGLVGPNHVLTSGPVDCGGPGTDPNNDLGELKPPSGDAGRGVRVAVVDSGILSLEELPAWMQNDLEYSDADVENDYLARHRDGRFIRFPGVHGTFVTGIIRQIAPGATIVVKRVLDRWGHASEVELADALTEVLECNPHIINLSLGCPGWDGKSTPVALRSVWGRIRTSRPPIVVVAAAGNKGTASPPYWPAAEEGVYGVGAVNRHGHVTDFSNHGRSVKLWALGDAVESVYATGPFRRKEKGILNRPFVGRAAWGGTSFAAPVVTGLIAARMSADGTNADVAAQAVVDDALPTHGMSGLPPGHDGPAPMVTHGITI